MPPAANGPKAAFGSGRGTCPSCPRPWKNASCDVSEAASFPVVTVETRFDRLARAVWARRSGPDQRDQRSHTEDRDHSPQVIGQNVEAHLGSDLVEGPGQEVGGTHPSLEGPERVFDGLSSHAHGLGHAAEPVLHPA